MAIVTGQTIVASDVALGANMPSGAIIMWSGTIANIPAGWIICDGNNGTPNLLGKFVEGVATAATNPGTTGGALSKTTTTPSHALTTTEMPAHTHGITVYGGVLSADIVAGSSLTGSTASIATASAGSDGGHTHPNSSVADIRPPYYDIAFLMKT